MEFIDFRWNQINSITPTFFDGLKNLKFVSFYQQQMHQSIIWMWDLFDKSKWITKWTFWMYWKLSCWPEPKDVREKIIQDLVSDFNTTKLVNRILHNIENKKIVITRERYIRHCLLSWNKCVVSKVSYSSGTKVSSQMYRRGVTCQNSFLTSKSRMLHTCIV